MSTRPCASRTTTAAASMAAAVVFAAGCGSNEQSKGEAEVPPARDASPAATVVATPAGPRRPPQRIDPRAAASGEIRVEAGPFTDRVRASGLRLRGGVRPEVSGRLLNVADVSEVLLLELRADFYDRQGRYLGSGGQTFEDAEAFFDERLRFRIRGGKQRRPAEAALLTVPQLVNE